MEPDRLLMYTELADWWPVMSDPGDYAEEAGLFVAALRSLSRRPIATVLELGSGGGNNALQMKRHFRMTLTDLSERMLDVSRKLNPECQHLPGDMRTLRLNRRFDAVFVHDAVGYMLTEDDLRAAMVTALVHLEPGGPALFVPDFTEETFEPEADHGGHDCGTRAMRYLSWTHAPEPGSRAYRTDFVYVLQGAHGTEVHHEVHEFGLFSRLDWLRLLGEVGFEAYALPYDHSSFHEGPREMFAGIKP
jgi:SAM-dependent methyltransferase